MAIINNIEVDGVNYELGGITNIPIVQQTQTTVEIQPNVLNIWGEMLQLNITFTENSDDTIANEYMIQFNSGDIETQLSLPDNIHWIQTPTIRSHATYQISILNNFAILGEFKYNNPEVIPYQRVEYLESDSTAYIDTGLSMNDQDVQIQIDYMWTKYVQYGAIYGNYLSTTNTNCYRLLLNNETQLLNNHNTIVNESTGNAYLNANINTRYDMSINRDWFTLNGDSIQRTGVIQGEINNTNIALFNISITEPITKDIGLRIYSFTVSKQGVILMNLVPVKINEIGYMYDTITKTLFSNVGSGQFILGPNIE